MALFALCSGSTATAQIAAEEIHLTGVVRDFSDSHPDFQVMPPGGFGNYAGLVDKRLDNNNMPILLPNGYRVTWPALDGQGSSIAPHLADGAFANPSAGVRVLLAVQDAVAMTAQDLAKKAMLQSWGNTVSVIDDNATQAQYNAAVTVNDMAYVSEEVDHGALGIKLRNAPIGVVNEDKDLSDAEFGFSASKKTYTDTRIVITNNLHEITQGFPLGDLVVTTQSWNFSRADGALAPGGLRLADKFGQAMPVLMVVEAGDELYGIGPAAARRVRLPWGNHSIDFNTINASGLLIMQRAISWAASNNPVGLPCSGYISGDTPATLDSTPSSSAITSADTFNQWFNDVMGVNLSALSVMTLVRQPDDTYLFDDSIDPTYSERGGFYPIDGALFGNTSAFPTHNHHFTYKLQAQFTYDQSANQFLELTTDSDAWVFIGTKLAIDLGGIHLMMNQKVDLDRLCLIDGQTYQLRLFLANRYAPDSALRMKTNIVFESTEYPVVSCAVD